MSEENKTAVDKGKPTSVAEAIAAAPRRAPVPNSRNYNPPEREDPKHPEGGGAPLMTQDFHGVAPATAAVKSDDLKADAYVEMVFPKTIRICLPNHAIVTFEQGVRKVPVELADHWYFAKNGVKKHQ